MENGCATVIALKLKLKRPTTTTAPRMRRTSRPKMRRTSRPRMVLL